MNKVPLKQIGTYSLLLLPCLFIGLPILSLTLVVTLLTSPLWIPSLCFLVALYLLMTKTRLSETKLVILVTDCFFAVSSRFFLGGRWV